MLIPEELSLSVGKEILELPIVHKVAFHTKGTLSQVIIFPNTIQRLFLEMQFAFSIPLPVLVFSKISLSIPILDFLLMKSFNLKGLYLGGKMCEYLPIIKDREIPLNGKCLHAIKVFLEELKKVISRILFRYWWMFV